MSASPDEPNPEAASTDEPRGEWVHRPKVPAPNVSVGLPDQCAGEPGLVSADSAPGLIFATPLPRDPAWTGVDGLRLLIFAVIALVIGLGAVLLIAHSWVYPLSSAAAVARLPIVIVVGQALAYLLLLAYMYVLVTRERGQPEFLSALHWNWPVNIWPYVFAGFVLSLALQLLSHLLPMPKTLPIDTFFRTPAEAWVLTIFGVTLAPLMEELFFRGFLYPVLVRGAGFTASIFITAFSFALLHGLQLNFSWGPVLVIFLVGAVLTMVRSYKNSVAASLIIHIAYNGTISALMFVATDGFRHLEKLNQ